MTKIVTWFADPTLDPAILDPMPLNVASINWDEFDMGEVTRPGVIVFRRINSPIDQPMTVQVVSREISDIYQGTGIEKAAQLPIKKGLELSISIRGIGKRYDDAVIGSESYFPYGSSWTARVPLADVTDSAAVKRLLEYTMAALHPRGEASWSGSLDHLLNRDIRR